MNGIRSALRRKAAGFTLVEIMIVVLIIGILLAIAIPNFVTARNSGRARACVANLKQIDSAKQQYIMDQKQSSSFNSWGPTNGTSANALVPTYIRSFPSCPAGGSYTVNDGTTNPTCSYTDTQYPHSLT